MLTLVPLSGPAPALAVEEAPRRGTKTAPTVTRLFTFSNTDPRSSAPPPSPEPTSREQVMIATGSNAGVPTSNVPAQTPPPPVVDTPPPVVDTPPPPVVDTPPPVGQDAPATAQTVTVSPGPPPPFSARFRFSQRKLVTLGGAVLGGLVLYRLFRPSRR